MSDASRDDFYVGYSSAAPRALARWLAGWRIPLFGSVAALAVALCAAQASFGPAIFEYGMARSFEGRLRETPVPSLEVERPGGGTLSRYLLVGTWKRGAGAEVAGRDGEHIRMQGTLVYRDDQTMIEVVPGTVVAIDAPPTAPSGSSEDLGQHTFVGEIVDSKCFLGVMKPGHLKPHRSCAVRCISGGGPPVLLLRDADGNATYLLLVGSRGEALNHRLLDLVAEPLEVTGRLWRHDNWLVLRADREAMRRLE